MLNESIISTSKIALPNRHICFKHHWEGKEPSLDYDQVKRITQFLMRHILISHKVQSVIIQDSQYVVLKKTTKEIKVILYKRDMTVLSKNVCVMNKNCCEYFTVLKGLLNELLHSITE